MNSRFLGPALILGLLSAIGPFAIDMYLPALPSIGTSLGAGQGLVQMSLLAYIVALSVSQLVYGPLSDIVGRKPPLYGGIALFAVASVGCALATNIYMLIALRAVQGVGACAGTVIPRAIVRDLHTGPDAARLMSLLMLVFSISPILAPLSGSLVIKTWDWRVIFWIVTGAAVLALVLMATQLEETRPVASRGKNSLARIFGDYRRLLTDRYFVGIGLMGGCGIAAFFVYLANSSFVLINHYGLTPTSYSLYFALNAVAFVGTAQLNGWLTQRFGLRAVIRFAAGCFAFVMLALLAVMTLGIDILAVMASLLFVGYCFVGVIVPNATVLSLDAQGANAGTASALIGTLQLVVAVAAIGIDGLFANGTALPMVSGIAACAAATCVLSQLLLRPATVQPAKAQ